MRRVTQLAQDVLAGAVVDRVGCVQAEAVDVELRNPILDVLTEKSADRP